MSDDLGKKVQQIAQLLGQNDVPDNVKELVSLIAASLDNKGSKGENKGDSSLKDDTETVRESSASGEAVPSAESSERQHNTAPIAAEHADETSGPALNKDILATAKRALSRFNESSDPRINLLNAIKPFMNNRRQKKIGNCIQLLQIAGLSRLLNEQEK